MPKDNNQQPTTNSNPVSITDDMPPVMIEDTLPPMAMDNQPPPVTNPQPQSSDSGSAAPSNDVIMPLVVTSGPNTGKPAKKFGSGKIIATILGLFLLIGGVGAGTYLVQQNQDIAEKAKVTSYADKCKGVVCKSNEECRGDGNCVWVKPAPEENIPGYVCTTSNCPGPEFYCQNSNTCLDAEGYKDGKPIPMPTNSLFNACKVGDVLIGNKCIPPGNCQNNTGNCYVKTKIGVGDGDKQVCDGPHWTTCAEGYICSNEDCVPSGIKTTKPSDNETTSTTTTTTSSTAQCQNIKAYTPTWTLLTSAQLGQLKSGDSVNFCVTGSASSGSFDRAKFTINGIVQAETTTVRPTSTDFCQLYVIPTGVTTFNVTAQIHHLTLGWK